MELENIISSNFHGRLDHILNSTSVIASLLASCVLMLMCIHHLYECVSRRLLLFPPYLAPFIGLNAGTLALLGFSVKPPFLNHHLFYTLMGSVLASALLGAYMPSLAMANRRQIWCNVAGTTLLLMTIISNILYKEIYKDFLFHDNRLYLLDVVLIIILICVSLDIPILFVQAWNSDLMISEVSARISIRLQQLEIMDPKSISERGRWHWISWEDLECRTWVKLMMALTSNLQNVASRSPSSAILAISFLVITAAVAFFGLMISSGGMFGLFKILYIPTVSVLMLGIICVNRWLRVAIHDTRPLRSLLCDTHPLYQRQKMTGIWLLLKAGPPRPFQRASIWELTAFILKSILYCFSALIMLSMIIPMHWMLLVSIRYTHALTTLLVRMLKPPLRLLNKALLLCMNHTLRRCAPVPAVEDSALEMCLDAGVIHMTGEDPRAVQKLFAASAKLVIQRQIVKARSKSTIALEALLKISNQACFFERSVVYEVLDKRGVPDVSILLHAGCHYGEQYGWSLTILSLLGVMSKVEVEGLGTCKTTLAAMEAYRQAMQMVEVVDEMHRPTICLKEMYLEASALMWSSLLNKSRWWPRASMHVQVNVSNVHIMDVMLSSTMSQLQGCVDVFPCAMEVVKAYTMYTVCQNLRRWSTNNANAGSVCLVQHIEFLLAEVLAACLSSLPAVLETCTRRAVYDGNVAKIENAILLVCQAQQIWKKLQWPQCNINPPDVVVPGFSLNQYWLQ